MNAATWQPAAHVAGIRALYMRVWRTIVTRDAMSTPQHVSDKEVLCALKVPTLEVQMIVCRLKYFARLLAFGPPQLLALIEANSVCQQSWLMRVAKDLEWVAEIGRDPIIDELPSPVDDLPAWC
eukprot:7772008-Alexandrium_andersonii.AAC.1